MKKTIAWVLPSIFKGSGGLRTIFNRIGALAECGFDCQVFVPSAKPASELTKEIAEFYQLENVTVHPHWRIQDRFDMAVATMWHTAHQTARLSHIPHKLYFVQDFEPYFYEMGGNYILAENSYRLGLNTVCLGRWLATKLSNEFGVSCRHSDFGADLSTYRPPLPNQPKEFAVCFIHQPNKPHRGPRIGLQALGLVKEALPSLKIYLYGSNETAALPFEAIQMGLVSPAQLNELYQRCLAGLCISSSNPSRIPFEMMACGLPVVDIHRENTRYDLPDSAALLANPTPEGLKTALLQILADDAMRLEMGKQGAAFMSRHPIEDETRTFLEAVETCFRKGALPPEKAAFSMSYGKPPVKERSPLPEQTFRRNWPLLTYDVWDTLLRRRCHPDAIKLFTARYLVLRYPGLIDKKRRDAFQLVRERVECEREIGRREKAGGQDDEYEIHEVFQLWVHRVANRVLSPDESRQMAEDLFRREVEHEKSQTYLDTRCNETLRNAQAATRMFVSDFYMPAGAIQEILRHVHCDPSLTDGVSSCEARLNKRSGRLLRSLQTSLGIVPGQHLHLGDNEYSDVFVPRKLGSTGLHYWNPEEEAKRGRLKAAFAERPRSAGLCLQELQQELRSLPAPANKNAAQLELFRLGADYSILFFNFVYDVIEQLLLGEFESVYWFTREGEYFQRIYREIERHNPVGVRLPASDILEVSRIATFGASLQEPVLADLMRIWNMYSTQSLRSLFTSIDVAIEPYLPLLERHGLDPAEQIRYPWADPRVRQLFENKAFSDSLKQALAEKRTCLKRYFAGRGITEATRRLAIVDIGWRGTIQDNLAWVFPQTQITGFYFGLLKFLNVQPPNAPKRAFGPDQNEEGEKALRLLKFVSPLEMLCNVRTGSVQRYRAEGTNAIAERVSNPTEDAVHENYISHFQDGVLACVPKICDFVRSHALGSQEIKPLSMELLTRVLSNPPEPLAQAYFELNHNETFGMGRFEDKRKHLAQMEQTRSLHLTGDRTSLDRFLVATTWPQAFAKLCALPYWFDKQLAPPEISVTKEKLAEAEERFGHALTCLAANDHAGARLHALRSLSLVPNRLKAHFLLCHSFWKCHNVRLALEHFAVVDALCPGHPPAQNELALNSYQDGYVTEPIAVWTKLLEETPDYRPAVLNLARVHLREQTPSEANAVLAQYLKHRPKDPQAMKLSLLAHRLMLEEKPAQEGQAQASRRNASGFAETGPSTKALDEVQILNGEKISLKLTSDLSYLGIPDDQSGGAAESATTPAASLPAESTPSERAATNPLPPEARPMVSIIVPTLDRVDLTRACLHALGQHTPQGKYEVIIVDNGSTDGTVDLLAEEEKAGRIKTLRNATNLGFARACNQGAAAAQGRYVLFLNNDTEVRAGWLEPLLELPEDDASVACVGGKLLFPDGTIQHAGVALGEVVGRDPLLAVHTFYRSDANLPAANQRRVYQALTAACLLVRKPAFDAVGGFDEGFWNGYEDVDLCLRLQAQGWRMVYEPASVVTHHESQSGPARFQKAQENIRRLHQKWLGKAKLDVVVSADGTIAPAATTQIRDYTPIAAGEALTSIVILSHNQLAHTKLCLESIERHTPEAHELILVDNGSTDGTVDYYRDLVAKRDNVRVIVNPDNRGFAAGNNQGLALARGRTALLLNNDTVVSPGWLQAMLAVLRQHPDTGLVGPVSNRVSGPQLITQVDYSSLEDMPGFASRRAESCAGQSQTVTRLVGFCLLVRRAVIDRIGGLDERFGSGNFEDDDFCLRAAQAGFAARIALDSFVHHTGGQTFQGARIDYREAMMRNWRLFKAKWGIPAEAPIEKGYQTPDRLPEGQALKAALPDLQPEFQPDARQRWWQRPAPTAAASPLKMEIPSVARLGNLDEARTLFGRKAHREAWEATIAAIGLRPFHPEGHLLLAEIALAAGDGATARRCAERARHLAPNWQKAQKFLKGNLKGTAKLDWAAPPAQTDAPRLTVCLITKNEESFIGRCLESVREVAHQVVLLDTGSTDRTVEIARSLGAETHALAWRDDFAAARNASLEHARGDWVLVLDADEELTPAGREALGKDMRASKAMAYRLPIMDAGKEAEGCHYVPRLFRNAPGLHFAGRIHEHAFASVEARCREWGLENRLGTATLLHHGYQKETIRSRDKVERNLRLLRKAVEEAPGDANLHMNLGLELIHSGDREQGLAAYRQAFELLSGQPASQVSPELREALLTQMATHLMAAEKFEELVRLFNRPLATQGGLTASLHYALGLALLRQQRHAEAAAQMRQCLSKSRQATLTPVNGEIHTAAPHHCLALSLWQDNKIEEAAKAFAAGLKEHPKSRVLRLDWARFLAENGKPVEALQALHQSISEDGGDVAAWRLGGNIALSKTDFLDFAADWTGEAIKHHPSDPAIISQRAETLLLRGECQRAAELYREKAEPTPQDRAGLVVCELLGGQASPLQDGNEAAVSRAFIEMYQRWLSAGALELIQKLNGSTKELGQALPSAASLLRAAMSEADNR